MSNFTFSHKVFYVKYILKSFNSHISVFIWSFFEFGTVSKWFIREWVNGMSSHTYTTQRERESFPKTLTSGQKRKNVCSRLWFLLTCTFLLDAFVVLCDLAAISNCCNLAETFWAGVEKTTGWRGKLEIIGKLTIGKLTIYHTITSFNDRKKEDFWEHCGKRRKCWCLTVKAFGDDNFKLAVTVQLTFDRVDNNMGKGENADGYHFLLFPQSF